MASQTKQNSPPPDAPISEIPSATKPRGSRFRRFLKVLGPGLITGASDDDPSGIGTYAMAGVAGLHAVVDFAGDLSADGRCSTDLRTHRIGHWLRPGRHHAAELFALVGLPGDWAASVIANTINAAADIQAIAAGINLLVPVPILVLTVPVAVAILIVQVWGSYRFIERIFRWLTISLFAYIGAAFLAHPNWGAVLRGTFVPTLAIR